VRANAAPVPGPLRAAVHHARRSLGRLQVRRLRVGGEAPAAVVAAVRRALSGRPSADESAWIARIEAVRQQLVASPEPLEVIDLGAGPAHRFDTGDAESRPAATPTTRTLAGVTSSSTRPRWAYLLFRLVRELRPGAVLELGACVGVSAAYQAAALELNANGRLVTLEGAPVLAARAATTLNDLGLSGRATVVEGPFAGTLDTALADMPPVGLAFVDGHHVESATLDYTERILRAAADEAVIVFDDIRWSPGMRRAWAAIAADPRFALTVDLRRFGIAVVSASAPTRPTVTGRTAALAYA
jgi:predicted O-methyltransferase YrrM